MKKINLFLWGIVSTCITFFYRTEVCEAANQEYNWYVEEKTLYTLATTCDNYPINKASKAEEKLRSLYESRKRTLCPSGQFFLGCVNSYTGKQYFASHYSMNELATLCQGRAGICYDECPSPGSFQAPDRPPTAIYQSVCVMMCSGQDPITGALLGDNYEIKYCIILNHNSSDFANVNTKENTCAINTDVSLEDDTGFYSYTEKCYYSE